MNPAAKALWFVESHLAEELTLTTVAEAVGVSRFHMARAFVVATGETLMRYARGRRLSEAAKVLAAGAPDTLRVAVEAATARTKRSRGRSENSSA